MHVGGTIAYMTSPNSQGVNKLFHCLPMNCGGNGCQDEADPHIESDGRDGGNLLGAVVAKKFVCRMRQQNTYVLFHTLFYDETHIIK